MPNPQKYLKLRNGAIVHLDSILVVLRKDINDYNIVLKDCPVGIRADLGDVQFLEQALDMFVVPSEEVPASKLAVAE